MFEKDLEELKGLGADITTAEIKQQPELWEDTYQIYQDNKAAIEELLASARAMGDGRLTVVFTGAGTSDYVGDTVAPYLRRAGNTDLYDFKPIATTDIVSAPRDFLNPDEPTLLVSFARSGNSPESLAAVQVAKQFGHNNATKGACVCLDCTNGEILGMAGLVGAGRTETAEAIFGMRTITGGKIYKDGKELHIKSPEDAIANKIGLLTEDRRGNGIVGLLSVKDNTVLANLKKYGFPLNHKKMREDTDEYIKKLNTKTPTMDTPIQNLSGGNQQKVLVGRWLLTDPDILIVDEPTRGIDVGAKSEIHALITKLAGEGKAIIMISSEMPEVMGMSDRIVVMHEGTMTAVVDRKDFSSELILKYATSEEAYQPAADEN